MHYSICLHHSWNGRVHCSQDRPFQFQSWYYALYFLIILKIQVFLQQEWVNLATKPLPAWHAQLLCVQFGRIATPCRWHMAAALVQQGQRLSWVVPTETPCCTKPNILTVWCFTEINLPTPALQQLATVGKTQLKSSASLETFSTKVEKKKKEAVLLLDKCLVQNVMRITGNPLRNCRQKGFSPCV